MLVRHMQVSTVLRYTVLYCTVLYCAVGMGDLDSVSEGESAIATAMLVRHMQVCTVLHCTVLCSSVHSGAQLPRWPSVAS